MGTKTDNLKTQTTVKTAEQSLPINKLLFQAKFTNSTNTSVVGITVHTSMLKLSSIKSLKQFTNFSTPLLKGSSEP